MPEIKIGDTPAGDGAPCYIVGEIGINHNGDLGIAKKLIDVGKPPAKLTTTERGGRGAVREICDLIIRAQQTG